MTGFELRTSDIRSDRSAGWATTTARDPSLNTFLFFQIDLDGNRLTELTPSFADLNQLKFLFLSDNQGTML